MQKSRGEPERRDPALRPPHRPGRAGRARRPAQRQRVHPEHEPRLRAKPRRGPRARCWTELKEEVPGVDIEVEQPLAHLISHMISGRQRPDRHQGLRRRPRHAASSWPSEIKAAIADVPGVELAGDRADPHGRRDPHRAAARRPRLLRREPGVRRPSSCRPPSRARSSRRWSRASGGSTCVVRLDEPYRTDYANLGQLRLDLPERPRPGRARASWPTSRRRPAATRAEPGQARERPAADRRSAATPWAATWPASWPTSRRAVRRAGADCRRATSSSTAGSSRASSGRRC